MEMKYIDTHAHLNLPKFDTDREAVIEQCVAEKVAVINVGTRKETSQKGVKIAQQFPHQHAIVGLHPLEVVGKDPDTPDAGAAESVFDTDFYRQLCIDGGEKVVGIGECGFDYFHHGDDTYALQCAAFERQIALASERDLPLMLHLRHHPKKAAIGEQRNAYDDALEILKAAASKPGSLHGNAHFFAGTLEQAKNFIELGFTISFTGVLTFTHDYDEIIQNIPLDRLHAETDCPYVAPVPHRGQRAEPWMVQEVYKKIAEIKNQDPETVRQQLLQNAQDMYKITT